MLYIVFEYFSSPFCYLKDQAALSLYAAGCTTGISVDIGHEMTTIVPVYEGHSILS